ncbi:MAG: hypothetical protein SOW94_01490 [Erysipelotrichaceae bacterium]|nr:hypothetical protein [Erysipelotrichaceae bacterium]
MKMNDVMAFISSAIIVEGILSYLNQIISEKTVNWKIVGAILLGCLVAFNASLDFFQLLGISEHYGAIGTILTGILISRGSNYVYELYSKLTNWKKVQDDGAGY